MSEEHLSSCYLEVSRDDLAANAQAVADYVGVPVMGVVKCDGYGVSGPEAARAWVSAGVATLAVSDPAEALTLRSAGFADQDILLLAPVADPDLLDALLDAGVILTVSGPASARFYAQRRGDRPVRAHVAVDTGMGRFGTRWTDTDELLEVYRTEGISFEGIFSHFSASFEAEYRQTARQLERFLSAVASLEQQGVTVGTRHIANSCAALRFPETRLDAVRVGSALVGRLHVAVPVPLKRVGVFKASVVDRRMLKKGDTTGYSSICVMKRDTDVAVVAIGHHNGFGLAKRPERIRPLDLLRAVKQALDWYRRPPVVRYNGKALPVVGRIGTQYTLVDASGTDIAPGDTVTADVDLLFPNPHKKYV
jgi:alanine racemase